MDIKLIDLSIIVIATDYNPTILNPDFLRINDIVPEEWGWKMLGSSITTPPFAAVKYDSNVSIVVETNKTQFSDKFIRDNPNNSKVMNIANKYVEVLPHVRYSAVGINFICFVDQDDANTFLINHFLKKEIYNNKLLELLGINLELSYPLEGGKFGLRAESSTLKVHSDENNGKKSGILFSANFHRNCKNYPSDKQVIEHLKNVEKDWEYFVKSLAVILGK